MQQTFDLFDIGSQFERLPLENADLRFMQAFYAAARAQHYKNALLAETPWRHEKINVWGKQHWQPRLTCWYGEPGKAYSYSGITLQPHPWSPTLLRIKADIEAATGFRFNSVLLNLYRNEQDSVGWHSDDEPELGERPVIASLSLGDTRLFRLKPKAKGMHRPLSIALADGSLLVMAGNTQKFWLHAIDKERSGKDPRINLTFRNIVSGERGIAAV